MAATTSSAAASASFNSSADYDDVFASEPEGEISLPVVENGTGSRSSGEPSQLSFSSADGVDFLACSSPGFVISKDLYRAIEELRAVPVLRWQHSQLEFEDFVPTSPPPAAEVHETSPTVDLVPSPQPAQRPERSERIIAAVETRCHVTRISKSSTSPVTSPSPPPPPIPPRRRPPPPPPRPKPIVDGRSFVATGSRTRFNDVIDVVVQDEEDEEEDEDDFSHDMATIRKSETNGRVAAEKPLPVNGKLPAVPNGKPEVEKKADTALDGDDVYEKEMDELDAVESETEIAEIESENESATGSVIDMSVEPEVDISFTSGSVADPNRSDVADDSVFLSVSQNSIRLTNGDVIVRPDVLTNGDGKPEVENLQHPTSSSEDTDAEDMFEEIMESMRGSVAEIPEDVEQFDVISGDGDADDDALEPEVDFIGAQFGAEMVKSWSTRSLTSSRDDASRQRLVQDENWREMSSSGAATRLEETDELQKQKILNDCLASVLSECLEALSVAENGPKNATRDAEDTARENTSCSVASSSEFRTNSVDTAINSESVFDAECEEFIVESALKLPSKSTPQTFACTAVKKENVDSLDFGEERKTERTSELRNGKPQQDNQLDVDKQAVTENNWSGLCPLRSSCIVETFMRSSRDEQDNRCASVSLCASVPEVIVSVSGCPEDQAETSPPPAPPLSAVSSSGIHSDGVDDLFDVDIEEEFDRAMLRANDHRSRSAATPTSSLDSLLDQNADGPPRAAEPPTTSVEVAVEECSGTQDVVAAVTEAAPSIVVEGDMAAILAEIMSDLQAAERKPDRLVADTEKVERRTPPTAEDEQKVNNESSEKSSEESRAVVRADSVRRRADADPGGKGVAVFTDQQGQRVEVLSDEVLTQEIVLNIAWPRRKGRSRLLPRSRSVPDGDGGGVVALKTQQPFRHLHVHRVMRVLDVDEKEERRRGGGGGELAEGGRVLAVTGKTSDGDDSAARLGSAGRPKKPSEEALRESRSTALARRESDRRLAAEINHDIRVEMDRKASSLTTEQLDGSEFRVERADRMRVVRIPGYEAREVGPTVATGSGIRDVVDAFGRALDDERRSGRLPGDVSITCEAVERRAGKPDDDVIVVRRTILDGGASAEQPEAELPPVLCTDL